MFEGPAAVTDKETVLSLSEALRCFFALLLLSLALRQVQAHCFVLFFVDILVQGVGRDRRLADATTRTGKVVCCVASTFWHITRCCLFG